MSRLIVNADDFGLTSGVNRAVLELHNAGVLTSTTLMARAAATEEALSLALATPTLGVGCHVVLVDGEPILSPTDLPNLTEPATGRFQPKLGRFLANLYRSPLGSISGQIESETLAQIASLQARGLCLTHIDTHKHTHMFPRILRPVLRAARAAGIRCVRNPFESEWSLAATSNAPFVRRAEVRLLGLLRSSFLRIVAEEGFTTTAGSIGVLATGTLDEGIVAALLAHLPSGDWELVTHPGYNDADLAYARTRLLASRETERRALLCLQNHPGLDLVSFSSLNPSHSPAR